MQFDIRRFASLVSWIVSPVVVAPAVYLFIVFFGYSSAPRHFAWFIVLFLSATVAPMFLIYGLKKIGRVSDYTTSPSGNSAFCRCWCLSE